MDLAERGMLPMIDGDFDGDDVWVVSGTHYQRIAAAWRESLERHKEEVTGVFRRIYGGSARELVRQMETWSPSLAQEHPKGSAGRWQGRWSETLKRTTTQTGDHTQ
jgi:hypothetical protein